jgi:hypothetical protein
VAKKEPSEPADATLTAAPRATDDETEPIEPVEIPVSPGANVRALRERITAESRRGTAKLTKALTLLEAEYDRVLKVTGAPDVVRLRQPSEPPAAGKEPPPQKKA